MGVSDITGKVVTSRPALPQIYAYTTPQVPDHNGWTKIGYTEQKVEKRLDQQSHTIDVDVVLQWHGNATYEDTGEVFKDTAFHDYLRRLGVADKPNTEWFQIEPSPAHIRFYEFRENHGVTDSPAAMAYRLRSEQDEACERAADYATLHEAGEFLWNAKPRFGKTLAAYDLVKRLGAQKVLVVTNRPAIANSWYDDYISFLGTESGLAFISSTSSLAGRPHCVSRDEWLENLRHGGPKGFIEFVSLQDLKGSIEFGGKYRKLEHVAELTWDLLVIDEAHEGVDTFKTDVAFDHIKRAFTLHLSGTPFKAIANEKFPEDAIYNWTYADEQRAKRNWNDPELPNPYAELPQLNMFTYQMSEIVAEKAQRGVELDGQTVEYAFDLNEFFATNTNGYFRHNDDVDRFLDALTTQTKYPFSTPELRDELRHTLWMLNRVDSAKALAKKLKKHPVFGGYEIVLAAGDGKLDDDEEAKKSLEAVREAIDKHDRTITISVGQLTTGVTVPEWTAVLMLSNMKSPSLYMQAAFRAQNPCLFCRDGKFLRKENAYVFDFDPARTLTIFEQFANDLYSDTSNGGGDLDSRKQRIRTLLNFFPVIGEDEDGEMVELDAERVLSIPRKIRSQEVVRRGFMSDFLFQNIGNVFRAPKEVIDIIQALEPHKAPNKDLGIGSGTAEELGIDGNGDVSVPEEEVIGKAAELFGDKKYKLVKELERAVGDAASRSNPTDDDKMLEQLSELFQKNVGEPLVEAAVQDYGDGLKDSQKAKIKRRVKADIDIELNKKHGDFKIKRTKIEAAREAELAEVETQEDADEVNERHDKLLADARDEFLEEIKAAKDEIVESAGRTIVREVETAKREDKKRDIEGTIKDHLRGFSRTIPSFLMAYGTGDTTLANFDEVIPDEVFKEVTSITVEQFRFLRDGGDYKDEATGETKHFEGRLFDPVVFDDSVAEFIRLRGKLANYLDETHDEDIFDYVPPQKTNQIFTPRKVVEEMVGLLEKENPGCFDDPSHTFADLYMKSGLYITEIIKRLYASDGMRAAFPDDRERLDHILERQVFGIAPTEIIYQIATHFILGYDDEVGNGCDTNFVCADSAALAKEGKLQEFVEATFGGKLEDVPDEDVASVGDGATTSAAPPSQGASVAVAAGGDWIIAAIESEGLECVDKRSVGGNLWVIGGESLKGFMRDLEKRGARFTYKSEGGKATGRRPAWYIPASAAERALKHGAK
ncbi:DEAD/DEAH box helicase family protein [Paratractidigestivibacter sp.]|uniref:DEAD/DEAH box helicase family protein n=1 Tax=Paratractidigestivibacter sp. TaxID=2847316 RepID=UPI002AC977D3|nr:DEAD/DEAH box helicase family protein [Paratractidigestivibacter sp.]